MWNLKRCTQRYLRVPKGLNSIMVTKKKTKKTVREKILNFLDRALVYYPAKVIAKRTRSNYNSVRRELAFLYSKKFISKSTEDSPPQVAPGVSYL